MSIDLTRIKEAAEKAHAEQAVAHTTTLRCVACKREFGQPAPAPTREQIAPLIDKEAFTPLDSTMDYPRWINERAFRQENAYRKAESILALFAKGGTP